MQVDVVRPSELGERELTRWRELLRADARLASPFLTPTFARAVAVHRPATRIAVLRDGPHIRGFLSYEPDSERVGWPLGRVVSDVQGIVAEPDLECDLPTVVRALGVCTFRFDHVLCDQAPFAPFHRSLHQSPILDLTHGHDAYLHDVRSRSKTVIPDVARRKRALARDCGDIVIEWRSTRPADLTTLVEFEGGAVPTDRSDRPVRAALGDCALGGPRGGGLARVRRRRRDSVRRRSARCGPLRTRGWGHPGVVVSRLRPGIPTVLPWSDPPARARRGGDRKPHWHHRPRTG